MIQTSSATFFIRDGAVFITTVAPGACGCCGRSAFLFTNRNGRTVCVLCDGDALKAAPVVFGATQAIAVV